MYGVPPTGSAASATPITGIWRTSADRLPLTPLSRGRQTVVLSRS
jgi:hypothetical protein